MKKSPRAEALERSRSSNDSPWQELYRTHVGQLESGRASISRQSIAISAKSYPATHTEIIATMTEIKRPNALETSTKYANYSVSTPTAWAPTSDCGTSNSLEARVCATIEN